MTEASPNLSASAQTLLASLVSKGRMAITPAIETDARTLLWLGYAASWGVPDMNVIRSTPKGVDLIENQETEDDEQ